MPRDRENRIVWPEPPAIQVQPRIWSRWRLVVPCFDEEQARRISAQLAEIAGHDIEAFYSVTDNEGSQQLGDVVVLREQVPTNCLVAATEEV